jgi:hypothetical protein
MDRVPQSYQLNPAFQPKCDFFLGLPNIHYNFHNSFSINDVLKYDPRIDSLIFPIHRHGNVAQFLQGFTDKNSLLNSFSVEGFSFGFRIKDFYFTLGISAKMDADLRYPTDMLRLAATGVFDSTSNYSFKNLGLNATAYGEFALGVSKNFNDQFNIGIRAKLLSGVFNMTTNNQKLDIFSTVDNDLYRLNVSSDMEIRTSPGYMKVDTDAVTGQIKNVEFIEDAFKKYKPFNSMGIGFDLGFSYTGIDKLILSASLLDLGFIRWNNGGQIFRMKKDTSFIGLENIDILNSDTDIFNKFVDSLASTFRVSQYKSSYTTWLPTKVYMGVEYMPASFFSLGFLSLSEFYRQRFYQQFMFSANLRLARMFMLSTSYSVYDNGFTNMGVGLSCRLSPPILYFIPLNFYIIMDNIPLYLSKKDMPVPYKLNAFNLRLGFNIVFGCGQQRKMRDKPLILD